MTHPFQPADGPSKSPPGIPGFGPTRSFRAASMRDAFAQVKATIGSEAIILHTRDHGGSVDATLRFEVVAAFPAAFLAGTTPTQQTPPAPQAPPAPPAPRAPTADDAALVRQIRQLEHAVKSLEAQLGQLHRIAPKPAPELLDPPVQQLVDAGIDRQTAELLVTRAIRRNAPRQGLAVARPPDLGAELARTIVAATPIWDRPAGTVHAFIGPAGAGKTSSLLKIAGLATFQHRRSVALISTDVNRLGAFEQLAMYADVMGIPVRPARDRAALDKALEQFADIDLVLVDTPGLNAFDDASRLRVMKVIAAREIRQHLVVPATTTAKIVNELVESLRGPALESVVITRVDEAAHDRTAERSDATRGLGAVVACCVHTDVPVSHVSDGPEIPDDIHAVDAMAMTDAVVARAV